MPRSRLWVTAITVFPRAWGYLGSMESQIERSCLECERRPESLFCDLSPDTLHDFDSLKSRAFYSRGTKLFEQGQSAEKVFILCQGRARLSVGSESGSQLTLHIAAPGEFLGLSAALAGRPHQVTAQLLDDAEVAVIRRKDLLDFLRQHSEACLEVVSLLSEDLHFAYQRVRSVGLGRTRRRHAAHVN